jgi:hypothetical protein
MPLCKLPVIPAYVGKLPVIPAYAGIQSRDWMPAFSGMTAQSFSSMTAQSFSGMTAPAIADN